MRRLLMLLLLLLAPIITRATTVTLTGTLTDVAGNPINGTLYLQLPVPAVDTSTNRAVATTPLLFRLVNGAITSPAPNVIPNDVMSPANLYYQARALDSSGTLVYAANYVIPSVPSTFNIGLAIPTVITTSNISFLTPANQTGNNTFTGTNIFSGTVTLGNLNSTEIVDGTRNTTIQQAINRFASGNGTVIVPTNQTITSELNILGSQPNVTLQCTNNAVITKGFNGDMVGIQGAGSTVRDCIFDGAQASFTGGAIIIASANNVNIINNQIRNCKNSALYGFGCIAFDSSKNVLVRHNRLTNINAAGIFGRNNSDSAIIEDNYIDTTLSNGLNAASDIAAHGVNANATVNNWIIKNNTILHGGASFCVEIGDFGGAVQVGGLIQGNNCKQTVASPAGLAGYSLGFTTPGVFGNQNTSVIGNYYDANGFSAAQCFEANNADHVTFQANICKMGTQAGPNFAINFLCDPCSNSTFIANVVSVAFSSGTIPSGMGYTAPTAFSFSNNVWVGNQVDLTGSAVAANAYLIQCNNAGATCNNNFLVGNYGTGTNTASDAGIRISKNSGTMTGNTIGENYLNNFNAKVNADSGTTAPPILPIGATPATAGGADIGTASLPFGNLWLGTAATNNFKFQPAATAQATTITIADPALASVGLPLKIASGTATLTANATLTTNTCQTAITVAATGAATTDSIEWSYATAPATGDALETISPYLTSGNVNFTRCNTTSASQNVTAIVINWRVIR